MKFLVSILILMFSARLSAQARPATSDFLRPQESQFQLYLYTREWRFERASSQELVDRQPVNLSVAYQLNKVSFLLEHTRFKEISGNLTSAIERTHQDLSLWVRHHFLQGKDSATHYSFFGGFGLGLFEEEVKTRLMGFERSDKSAMRMMSGLALGGDGAISLGKSFSLISSLEGRALVSSEFEPNLLWSAAVRLGVAYHF